MNRFYLLPVAADLLMLAGLLLAAPSPGCHPEPDPWPVLEKSS